MHELQLESVTFRVGPTIAMSRDWPQNGMHWCLLQNMTAFYLPCDHLKGVIAERGLAGGGGGGGFGGGGMGEAWCM